MFLLSENVMRFVLIKVNLLIWRLMLNSLSTRLNIYKRCLVIPYLHFPVCDGKVGLTNHLSFPCMVTSDLRVIVFWWQGIDDQTMFSVDEWLTWFCDLRLRKPSTSFWRAFFYVMWWYVQLCQNKYFLGLQQLKKSQLFDKIISKAYFWCPSRYQGLINWNVWL